MRFALMPLLLLALFLFASCAPKAYTSPEIGMPLADFVKLCGYEMYDRWNNVITAKGTTETFRAVKTETRPADCDGTFTFVNKKLTSIEH